MECAAGYDASGEPTTIDCQADGQWTVAGLTCTIRDCGSSLPVSTTADVASSECSGDTTVGSTCTAQCNEGYTQVAGTVGSFVCATDGTWTATEAGDSFACSAVTCDTAIGTGNAASFVCPSSAFGATCTVECDLGYNTISSTPFTCGEAGFTGGSYTCEIVTCGSLPTSGDGVVTTCASDEYLAVSLDERERLR